VIASNADMFDSADLDHKIDKLTYKHEVPHLRE
jgi:hypothetical protein